MERLTDDQKLERLGVTPNATPQDALRALADVAEKAQCDPGVLDILERDAVSKLRERFSYGDESLLAPDALERATRFERGKWIDQYDEKQAAAEAALPVIRARTEARIARSQELPGEAGQAPANRTEALLARLLDETAERNADEWIARSAPADIVQRYAAATDDGPDRAFVRVVERRHAARLIDLSKASDPASLSRKLSDAIEQRRQARVSPHDLDAIKALDALDEKLRRSRLALEAERAKVKPNGARVEKALGRALATAGRGH